MPVNVTDVLTIENDQIGPLRAPVMLIALSGLFDIAGVATTTLNRFAPPESAITIGEIDPDPFYDFTHQRPVVETLPDETRTIRWPQNAFEVVRGLGDRDLVVVVGVEPHLAWPTYSASIQHVAELLGCEAVVTVGSAAEAIPHTRTPAVTGSTTDADLAGRLGIGRPSYQGVTGVIGVIQADLADAGIPSVSLRVGVPHYLMNAEHPRAVAALSAHLSHVLGVPAPAADDHDETVERWAALHDEVVDNDPQLKTYVNMLEQAYDRRAEAAIPSADDLGAQFEQFLDEQRDDPEA